MRLVAKVKGLFKKQVVLNIESPCDLVQKMKWAQVEVTETHDALVRLLSRLQDGAHQMTEAQKEAQKMLEYYQDILGTARLRASSFTGQAAQVSEAIQAIDQMEN